MRKFISVLVVILLIFSLTTCANTNVSEQIKHDNIDNKTIDEQNEIIESAIDSFIEESVEEDPIIGHWVIDSVQFNNVVYNIDELKNLLDEEDFNSMQLEFEFTDHEVTIYTCENKATTGYKVYEEETQDEVQKYIDESGQLIFTLVNGTLQIEQSQSTLIFVKSVKTEATNAVVDTETEIESNDVVSDIE